MTPRYLVVGPQGSGKSTFGALLADALNADAADTSAWPRSVLRDLLGREPTRPEMVKFCDALKRDDPTLLVARCWAAGARVACGPRTREEVAACKERWPEVRVVFIARPPGPEAHLDTSFDLDESDADVVIRPDGLPHAEVCARLLARGWGR